MERLQRRQMTGTISADRRFNSQVGSGSRVHDFAGVVCRIAKTSFSVAGWNEDRSGTVLLVMTGGGAAAVDARILFTLLWKKSANSPAVSLADTFCCDACSSSSKRCQSCRGLFLYASISSDQYFVNFAWKTSVLEF